MTSISIAWKCVCDLHCAGELDLQDAKSIATHLKEVSRIVRNPKVNEFVVDALGPIPNEPSPYVDRIEELVNEAKTLIPKPQDRQSITP